VRTEEENGLVQPRLRPADMLKNPGKLRTVDEKKIELDKTGYSKCNYRKFKRKMHFRWHQICRLFVERFAQAGVLHNRRGSA
jgi:hypothetical protein